MNYLPKNRLKYPHLKRTFALIAIFVFGAVIFSLFDGAIISIVTPAWKVENVITRGLRNSVTFFNSQKALIAENARLGEKVSSLEIELTSLSIRQTQENVLSTLLGREHELGKVLAAVLTHPPQTPYDFLVIDAGGNQSITLGGEVSLPEGPILGRVSEVFSRSAKVKLFSASGEETSAVLERNNVPVTLLGTGGGNFKVILPRDVAVENGDKILSANINSQLLAVVGEVNVQSTDSFKEVLAKSPTNIFSLRFVFVTP